eukprot:182387_1
MISSYHHTLRIRQSYREDIDLRDCGRKINFCNIILLTTIMSLTMSIWSVQKFLPIFLVDQGFSAYSIGIILAIQGSTFVIKLPLSILIDKHALFGFGRQKSYYALFAIIMSLLAICTTIISRNVDRLTRGQYVFLLSLDLILQFFIYGIMRSIWESFILMNATGPRSGQILATMTIIPDFVNVIYLTAFGRISKVFGWNEVFTICAIFQLISLCLLPLLSVPKEIKLKTKSLIQKSYHLYRNPTIFAFVVFNTVVSVGIFITGVTILTLLYAKSVLSLSNAEIGLYGAGGEIITIIAVQTYGILADKFYYNTRTVYIISCFIGLFGYILYIYGTRVFQFAYVAYVLESLVVGLVKFGPLYFIDRLSMTELSVFDISIYHFSTTIVIIPGIILLGWILEFHGFVSAYA